MNENKLSVHPAEFEELSDLILQLNELIVSEGKKLSNPVSELMAKLIFRTTDIIARLVTADIENAQKLDTLEYALSESVLYSEELLNELGELQKFVDKIQQLPEFNC